MTGYKKCSKCNDIKPYTEFHRDRSRSDGLTSRCKSCRNNPILRQRMPLHDDGMATCVKCELSKPLSGFEIKIKNNGYRYRIRSCKQCVQLRASEWGKTHYYRRYSMTREQYDAMLEDQDYKCANKNCDGPAEHVDHDHSCCPGRTSCGKCVRGILCRDCNLAEGRLRSDVNIAQGLIDYMIRTKS